MSPLRVLGQRTSQGAAWRRSLWASSHQCGAAANGTSHQPVAARLHMPSPTSPTSTSTTNNNTTTTTTTPPTTPSRSFSSCTPRPRTPSFSSLSLPTYLDHASFHILSLSCSHSLHRFCPLQPPDSLTNPPSRIRIPTCPEMQPPMGRNDQGHRPRLLPHLRPRAGP